MNLAITCGLPCSGKSDLAYQLQERGWVYLNPASFREALCGEDYRPEVDNMVWAIMETAARALLIEGYDVLVGGMNPTSDKRMRWSRMAKSFGFRLQIHYANLNAEDCIARCNPEERDPETIKKAARYFRKPTKYEGEIIKLY